MFRLVLLLGLLLALVPAIRAESFFALVVRDIDESTAWYADFLAVTETNRMTDEAGSYDIRILRNDRLVLEVMELASAVARPDGIAMGLFKAGFFVPDLDRFLAGVPEGIEPLRVVEDAANGVRFAQFEDPDGNLFQVFQELE